MVMKIIWREHADIRYAERFALYDITKDEIEQEIEKQLVKISEGYDKYYKSEKFKTIFKVRGKMATVEKAERGKEIYIITLWQSSEAEIELWKKKL